MKAQISRQRKICSRFWKIKVLNICAIAILSLVWLLAAAACGDAGEPNMETSERAGTLVVTGQITNVEARSLLEIRAITIAPAGGARPITLYVDDRTDLAHFTPSHARDHVLRGLPVTVRYRPNADAPTLTGIEDAAEERRD